MPPNPPEPPAAPPPMPPEPPAASSMPPEFQPAPCGYFGAVEAFGLGWRTLWSNYGVILGSALLAVLAQFIGSMVPMIGFLAGIALAPLSTAAAYQVVRVLKGERPGVGDIFQVFGPRYLGLVVINFLVGLIMLVGVVPAGLSIVMVALAASSGETALVVVAVAVGSVVAIGAMLVGTYLYMRASFAGLLYMEAPVGSLDMIKAIGVSWNQTRGHGMSLLGMSLLVWLLSVGSVLLLIVGVFLIGVPLAVSVMGAAYVMLFHAGRTIAAGCCVRCGYDRRGQVGGRCPECGHDG